MGSHQPHRVTHRTRIHDQRQRFHHQNLCRSRRHPKPVGRRNRPTHRHPHTDHRTDRQPRVQRHQLQRTERPCRHRTRRDPRHTAQQRRHNPRDRHNRGGRLVRVHRPSHRRVLHRHGHHPRRLPNQPTRRPHQTRCLNRVTRRDHRPDLSHRRHPNQDQWDTGLITSATGSGAPTITANIDLWYDNNNNTIRDAGDTGARGYEVQIIDASQKTAGAVSPLTGADGKATVSTPFAAWDQGETCNRVTGVGTGFNVASRRESW